MGNKESVAESKEEEKDLGKVSNPSAFFEKVSEDVIKLFDKKESSAVPLKCGGRISIHSSCLERFSEDIMKLLDNKEHSDVTLKCGDRTFFAHKSILSARSGVFSAAFRKKKSETFNEAMDITDVEPAIMEQFLRYIYSCKTDQLTMDTVSDLYRVAETYAVHSLKKKCASFMLENISRDSVCAVLLLAETFGNSELLDEAASFAAGIEGFLRTTEWEDFARQHSGVAVKVYLKHRK